MQSLPPVIVLWDTEYTAWEGSQERKWSRPDEYKEIVQIGAIRFDTVANTEIDAFSSFVKPVKNPELSGYFMQLTGITQAQVEKEGMTLASALRAFDAWIAGVPCYSFGSDAKVVAGNCELIGIPMITGGFLDIREHFTAAGIDVSGFASGTITEAFGEKSVREAHDALNDARTIGDGLRLLAARG